MWVAETPSLGFVPSDLEVTPNGLVSIVRGEQPLVGGGTLGIVAVDATSGAVLPIGGIPPMSNFGAGRTESRHSDLVAVTNDRAIAIGSFESTAAINNRRIEDATQIDVLAFNMTTNPPGVSVLSSLTWTAASLPGTNTYDEAGEAHDVAITPNGAVGVVHGRNWVWFIDMPTGALLNADQIGGPPGLPMGGIPNAPFDDDCSPRTKAFGGQYYTPLESAVDSIALTDTRAVVITSRLKLPPTSCIPLGTYNYAGLAYVYDLSNGFARSGPFLLDGGAVCSGLAYDSQDHAVHDLAISPDGALCVVTSNGVTSILDLTVNSLVGTPDVTPTVGVTLTRARAYLRNRDSALINNSWAAVVGDVLYTSPQRLVWTLDLYDLNNPPATGMPYVPALSWTGNNVAEPNQAHDIEFSTGNRYVGMRAERQFAMVDLLAAPTPALLASFPETAATGIWGPQQTFSTTGGAPSALCCDSVVGGRTNFAALGSRRFGVTTPTSRVDFYSFANTVVMGGTTYLNPLIQVPMTGGGMPQRSVLVSDIVVLPGNGRIAVKTLENANDPGPTMTANDLMVYSLITAGGTTTGQLLGQFGSTNIMPGAPGNHPGHLRAVDTVAAAGVATIAITTDPGSAPWSLDGPPNAPAVAGSGWVQVHN